MAIAMNPPAGPSSHGSVGSMSVFLFCFIATSMSILAIVVFGCAHHHHLHRRFHHDDDKKKKHEKKNKKAKQNGRVGNEVATSDKNPGGGAGDKYNNDSSPAAVGDDGLGSIGAVAGGVGLGTGCTLETIISMDEIEIESDDDASSGGGGRGR